MTPRYEEPDWIDRLTAVRRFFQKDQVASSLAAIGLNDDSPSFIEGVALGMLAASTDIELRRLALVAIGHSVRRHRLLAFESTRYVVRWALDDVELRGTAEDVLGDIEMFVSQAEEGGET